MIKHTQESLTLTRTISDSINNQTMHHHYHILYDIANTYSKDTNITYVEIGCYAGGSACLVLQRPNTKVISIDLGELIKGHATIETLTLPNIVAMDSV